MSDYRERKIRDDTQFEQLTDTAKEVIFSCLNFTDIKNCRLVSQEWMNFASCTKKFTNGVFRITLTEERDIVHWVQLNNVRLSLPNEFAKSAICVQCLLRSDKAERFLRNITSLELYNCSLTWMTLKKLVAFTPRLLTLALTQCYLKDLVDMSSTDDTTSGHIIELPNECLLEPIKGVKNVVLTEYNNLNSMTRVLQNVMVHCQLGLETLKVDYRPLHFLSRRDVVYFLEILAEAILLNKTTLKNLILNIRSSEILNYLGTFVFSRLENFRGILQLRVFKLAQPMSSADNVSVTVDGDKFLWRLQEFLKTQTQLESLAFPHVEDLIGADCKRWHVLDQTTKKLVKLRVPGALYLRRNALRVFTKLRVLFIGEKTLKCPGSYLQPTKFIIDRAGIARRNCGATAEISIYAQITYQSGNLFHVLEKFPNLTKFEFNAFRPLFIDRDVQAIVKYLPKLKHLSIAYCDFITDQGVTGIPLETCTDLIRLGTLYLNDIKPVKKLEVVGRPLSTLAKLVTLSLAGNGQITDVGLKFGLQFIDLVSIRLPHGKYISHWGIEKLGEQNPSLESVTLTEATKEVSMALSELTKTHPRLRRTFCELKENQESLDQVRLIGSTFFDGLVWSPNSSI